MSTDGERQARIDQIRARLDDRLRPCTVNITQARWLLGETERLTAELAAAQAREQAREQALVEAGAVLVEYVEHQLSLARLAAIEAWRAALAAAPEARDGE